MVVPDDPTSTRYAVLSVDVVDAREIFVAMPATSAYFAVVIVP